MELGKHYIAVDGDYKGWVGEYNKTCKKLNNMYGVDHNLTNMYSSLDDDCFEVEKEHLIEISKRMHDSINEIVFLSAEIGAEEGLNTFLDTVTNLVRNEEYSEIKDIAW